MTIDMAGEWIFQGRPFDAPYGGQIQLRLQQAGASISGELVQRQNPDSGQPPIDPEATRADVEGEILEDPQADNHLVILKRLNRNDAFRAVFIGVLSPAQDSVAGTFTNTVRRSGTFLMVKQS